MEFTTGAKMIYWTVTLSNNTKISSINCNWTSLPSLPIVSIDLHLPTKRIVTLEGFEKYLIISTEYHITRGGKGKIFDTLNILGKKKNDVYQISYHRKGKLFQCKNKWGKEWRPLIIKTFPKRDKTEKKRFEIQYSSPLSTNHKDWHDGLWSPSAKIHTKAH